MSHTKRYWIDDHSAIEDNDGKWVLHSDYAALVQQGIRDHGDWRSKLNFLEADYKAEIARLTAEKEVETRATFDAIRTITQLRDDYAALAAENERLRQHLEFFRGKFDAKSNKLLARILKDTKKFAAKEGGRK